jgi:hypothetical protein
MKLTLEHITNKHAGESCVIALHGPSLTPHIEKIQSLQKEGFRRISVNQWYDYFTVKPDYWVVSNTEFTIENSIAPNWFWDTYNKGWPKDIFNTYNVPLIFNETADLTPDDFIEKNLHCDYLPYDSKHFKNRNCRTILRSFKEYYEQNKNFNFLEYGNNKEMWQPLSLEGTNCHPSWAAFAGAWSRENKCCHKLRGNRLTLQESLQQFSGCEQHAGPGTSVGSHALILAILMGFKKIYVAGFDMDYSLGYASPEATGFKHRVNEAAIGHWKKIHKKTIINDLTIMENSARLLGIEIINLNENSWFNTLKIGQLP